MASPGGIQKWEKCKRQIIERYNTQLKQQNKKAKPIHLPPEVLSGVAGGEPAVEAGKKSAKTKRKAAVIANARNTNSGSKRQKFAASFSCPEAGCGRSFASAGGLSNHKRQSHFIKQEVLPPAPSLPTQTAAAAAAQASAPQPVQSPEIKVKAELGASGPSETLLQRLSRLFRKSKITPSEYRVLFSVIRSSPLIKQEFAEYNALDYVGSTHDYEFLYVSKQPACPVSD